MGDLEITDCPLNLEGERHFYKDLYESKHIIPLEGFEYYDLLSEIPTLNKDQQMALDNSITIKEVENAIKTANSTKHLDQMGFQMGFISFFEKNSHFDCLEILMNLCQVVHITLCWKVLSHAYIRQANYVTV